MAEAFGDLDPEIDARINDVADPSKWTGFHRIEKMLWVEKPREGQRPLADELMKDVTTLGRGRNTLTYQPAQLANGSVELLDEVARSKITGEEDRYSHTDLSDFQGNLTARSCHSSGCAPILATAQPGAGHDDRRRFAGVEHVLDAYSAATRLGARTRRLTPPTGSSSRARSTHSPSRSRIWRPSSRR